MAILSYTYASLKGIPACIFLIESTPHNPGHAWFALEKSVFQKTQRYQDVIDEISNYPKDPSVHKYYEPYIHPLEVTI